MIREILSPFYQRYIRWKELQLFKKALKENKGQIKLVIGSSGIFENGWVPSEAHFLNLLRPDEWLPYFKPGTLSNIAAEHVWEHLTEEDGLTAARTCFQFLEPGGRLRVAVPDGFHSDPDYIAYVKPGGHGLGAFDHKVLYTYKTFSDLFSKAGFKIEVLEYFDEHNEFHFKAWDPAHGHVRRTFKNDDRNRDGQPHYTSLLLDAIKP